MKTALQFLANSLVAWLRSWSDAWNRFWFQPSQPHTLCAIRVLAGGMLFYTHLVWTLNLEQFLGEHAWLPAKVIRHELDSMGAEAAWSHWFWIQSPTMIGAAHLAALIIFALFAIGMWTRVTSILAWLLAVSYCNRLYGSLFGLDQVNTMLAMCLMIGPSGDLFSVDAWRKRRSRAGQGGAASELQPKSSTTIAIRLIQLHMCLIYLFGGIGKMRGATWWNGTAMWFSLANQEYQSADLTWLAPAWPIINGMTHLTVFWETFYCALIWPKLTRPICLACAVLVHGGIALFMGMATFGTIMLVGNMAFVPPSWIERMTKKRSG